MKIFILLFVASAISGKSVEQSGCQLDVSKPGGKYPPLLLHNGQLALPLNEQKIIHFEEDDELQLYCHGSLRYEKKTYLKLGRLPESRSKTLTCKDGGFYIGNFVNKKFEVPMKDIVEATCNRRQEPRLLRTQEQCATVGANGETDNLQDLWTVQVGWEIGKTFIEQIRVCLDESRYGTIWTKHTIYGQSVDYRDVDDSRPPFRLDNSYMKRFYTWTTNKIANTLYSKKTQVNTIVKLLRSNKINGKPLIDGSKSGTNYFAKGHLAPDADFIYNVQQDATYYFFNVAPQFQSFNNGNWKALEAGSRSLAQSLGRELTVYTGTHKVLEYPDSKDVLTSIYLYIQDKYIPAPKYYWKVLYDPATKTAAAFIGLNDPHATEAPEELCTNVCSQMSWIDWKMDELDEGYMYCCSVEEARLKVPSIPKLETTGLLQLDSIGEQENCKAGPCECKCAPVNGKYSCKCTCHDTQVNVNVV